METEGLRAYRLRQQQRGGVGAAGWRHMAASPGDQLASAAARGDCAAVQALLEAGAAPDAQNSFGRTALQVASPRGRLSAGEPANCTWVSQRWDWGVNQSRGDVGEKSGLKRGPHPGFSKS